MNWLNPYLNRVQQIQDLAKKYEWREIDHQVNTYMLSFGKVNDRINVYYSRMTVGTCLDHPQKGKTQLYRKRVDQELLEKIFKNPRIHTNKGYRRRQND